MANMKDSLFNIRLLDDLARKDTSVHKLHPLFKLLTTVFYLAVVVSFERYEVSGLLPFAFYPILTFALAELPVKVLLKRLLLIEPLIIGIGILNPLFDNNTIMIAGFAISGGWVTFLSIFIKGSLTVAASVLLVATTGMDKLAAALRMLKVPKTFVLQLLLTYRYISVLIEEVSRMLRAYTLRAPSQKGIQISEWGSFAGSLILRTFDRAQNIYVSMKLRGFSGEYNIGNKEAVRIRDFAYLAGWGIFFTIARVINIPMLIGTLFTGVIR